MWSTVYTKPISQKINFTCVLPRKVIIKGLYMYYTYTVKNERSFQPFLGYLSCFYSCFYNSSHSPYHYTQLILNILQYGSLPLLCINGYARVKLCMGLGKYNTTSAVHYFGTGPKAFIRVVQHFGKGPGIVITLVPSIHPQLQDRFLILISFHGSHTTIANTINLNGELPL